MIRIAQNNATVEHAEKMVCFGRLGWGKQAKTVLKKIRCSVVDDLRRMRNINTGLSREVAREGNVLGGIFYSELGYQTPSLG